MNRCKGYSKIWFPALLLVAFVSGCASNGPEIPLITATAPTVTAVAPAVNATAVPINTKTITASFSKAMKPATLTTASFTLTCNGTPITGGGAVTYLSAGNVTTLPLPAATDLPLSAACTARITTMARDLSGMALQNDYVWNFTTGLAADTTRPLVMTTAPVTTIPGPTPGSPINTAISAVFNKDMTPATITAAGTFTLTGPGTNSVPAAVPAVTYAVGSRTATFHPATQLQTGTTYTATIAKTATDLFNNQLAGDQTLPTVANDYVWRFTTAGLAPAALVTVLPPTYPVASAIGVCPNAIIKVSFRVPSGLRMDPVTVSDAFIVTGPAPAFTPVDAASVVLDVATGRIATFTPLNPLIAGVTYTATIKGGVNGVKDLAIPANAMLNDYKWNFTAGPATGLCLPPVVLGRIATFGIAATAGITNTTTLPITRINGDAVLDPISGATCNHVEIDANGGFGLCGSNASTPIITGTVISPLYPDAGITSGAIKADLLAKFLSITPLSGPPAAGSLGGATNLPAGTTLGAPTGSAKVQGDNYFVPGVYQSITSLLITGDLTLDAKGNPNAVFVFQSSSTVGTADGAAAPGTHTRIILTGGAKASNVWWQAATSATLGTNSDFSGNILASADITMKTGATSCGRLLAGAFTSGAFVFDSNVVSVPGNVNAPSSCQ